MTIKVQPEGFPAVVSAINRAAQLVEQAAATFGQHSSLDAGAFGNRAGSTPSTYQTAHASALHNLETLHKSLQSLATGLQQIAEAYGETDDVVAQGFSGDR